MDKPDKDKSPFSQLHHISIVVKDIDKAVDYYESIGIGPFAIQTVTNPATATNRSQS